MAENQPRDFDVVLGGEAAPPVAGVVLGGLEGVKNRLRSSNVDVRVAALSDALNYGDAALDLVIQLLGDKAGKLRHKAFKILQDKTDIQQVRQALLDYNPWQFFRKLENWNAENFNTASSITNPQNIAYIVNTEQLKSLLQDPQANKVEALICEMWDEEAYYEVSEEFVNFVEILYNARKLLTNLKALFIGDGEVEEYKKSRRGLSDISLILEGFPGLEILQLRGCCDDLECSALQHNNLKTFIVETANISSKAISSLANLSFPELEYFELWFGRGYNHESTDIDKLQSIFSSQSCPDLIYLGLRSSEYADEIAAALAQSSIINSIEILDLSMGTLSPDGAIALLNCRAINQLHTLNLSNNDLFEKTIERFSKLDCLVITNDPDMTDSSCRYSALYE